MCVCVCVCVCERERERFFLVSLQDGVSLSYSPLALSYSSPTGLKASHLGARLPSAEPWAEEPNSGLRTLTPVREALQLFSSL